MNDANDPFPDGVQRDAVGILVDRVNDLLPPTMRAYWIAEDQIEGSPYGCLAIGKVDESEYTADEEELVQHVLAEAVCSGIDDDLPYTINPANMEDCERAEVAYRGRDRSDVMEEVERYGG